MVLALLALPIHLARADTRRDGLATILSHGPMKGALAYLGGCEMPAMPHVADPRRADRSDPRGVGGVIWWRIFLEGAVTGVAMRPTDARALQVTVGYVTWF